MRSVRVEGLYRVIALLLVAALAIWVGGSVVSKSQRAVPGGASLLGYAYDVSVNGAATNFDLRVQVVATGAAATSPVPGVTGEFSALPVGVIAADTADGAAVDVGHADIHQ